MLVHAVPGINHGNVQIRSQQMRRARIRMAYNNGIGAHRAQSVSGIQQRFAFLNA